MLIGFYAGSTGGGMRPEEELLQEAGCTRIFGPADYVSEEVIEYLREGDTLVVVQLSRLAKTIENLIFLVARLQNAGVTVHAIQDQVIPGTPAGDSFGAVCLVLAEYCRSGQTTDSKDKKSRRGRPAVLHPDDQARAERLLKRASVLEVARLLKVSPATIYRYFPRRRSASGARSVVDSKPPKSET